MAKEVVGVVAKGSCGYSLSIIHAGVTQTANESIWR